MSFQYTIAELLATLKALDVMSIDTAAPCGDRKVASNKLRVAQAEGP